MNGKTAKLIRRASPGGRLEYRKRRYTAGQWSGRTRLRIYTEDLGRLRAALGT